MKCGNRGSILYALVTALSVFQNHVHDCVRHYLHSDCAFFGHSLVHPNEGHIVVKIIDRTLK